MIINLSPQRSDRTLQTSKSGDVLTINGEAYDFSFLPDGATLPAGTVPCDFIVGDVERVNGILSITLILPHRPNAPRNVLFPDPIVNPPDGPIVLPMLPDSEVGHVDA